MKVINLFIGMLDGRILPKNVLYKNRVYEYSEKYNDYIFITNNNSIIYLFTMLFNNEINVLDVLNTEIEILTMDDKKIEKVATEESCGYTNIIDIDDDGKHLIQTSRKDRNIYIPKINEVIDGLNYLLEKSDKE